MIKCGPDRPPHKETKNATTLAANTNTVIEVGLKGSVMKRQPLLTTCEHVIRTLL